MEAIYMGKEPIVARIGDVVVVPNNMRGIVIAVDGTFVRVLGIVTSKVTGDTTVLEPRLIHDCPASQCTYLEKQTLNYPPNA